MCMRAFYGHILSRQKSQITLYQEMYLVFVKCYCIIDHTSKDTLCKNLWTNSHLRRFNSKLHIQTNVCTINDSFIDDSELNIK